MLGLPTAIADLVIPKWVKLAIPVGIVLAIVGGFFLWLHFHDRKVIDQHDTQLNESALVVANEARAVANEKQELRNEAYESSKQEVANASDAGDYLRKLRANQDRERAKAARR